MMSKVLSMGVDLIIGVIGITLLTIQDSLDVQFFEDSRALNITLSLVLEIVIAATTLLTLYKRYKSKKNENKND